MIINTIMDSEHTSLGNNVLLINKFQIFVYVSLIFAFSDNSTCLYIFFQLCIKRKILPKSSSHSLFS